MQKIKKKNLPRKTSIIRVLVLVVAILVGITLISLWWIIPLFVLHAAARKIIIVPKSEALQDFIEGRDLYQRIYIFNLMNPEEVYKGQKPSISQMGPYTFKFRNHRSVAFKGDDLLQYIDKPSYIFMEKESKGKLEDKVTTVDPLVALVTFSSNVPEALRKQILGPKFGDRKTFAVRTVRQLLYEGYRDDILDFMRGTLGVNLPDKMGYLYGRNGSAAQAITINTGAKNINDLGKIILIDGKKQLPFYKSPCDKIEGTNGERQAQFPPSSPPPSITVFMPSLCRPWRLELSNEGETDVYGLQVTRYAATKSTFSIGKHTENAMCSEPRSTGIAGTFDASLCHRGLPTVLSLPHFLHTDAKKDDFAKGINPDPSIHDLYLDLYGPVGATINAAIRVQTSIQIQKGPNDGELLDTIFPVFWQEVIVPNETLKVIAKRLISKVQIPLRLYPLIALIIAIIYLITSLLLVVWLIRKERAKKILKKFHMSTGDVTLSDSSVSDSSESRTLSWYDNLLSTDRGPESHAQREEPEDTTDTARKVRHAPTTKGPLRTAGKTRGDFLTQTHTRTLQMSAGHRTKGRQIDRKLTKAKGKRNDLSPSPTSRSRLKRQSKFRRRSRNVLKAKAKQKRKLFEERESVAQAEMNKRTGENLLPDQDSAKKSEVRTSIEEEKAHHDTEVMSEIQEESMRNLSPGGESEQKSTAKLESTPAQGSGQVFSDNNIQDIDGMLCISARGYTGGSHHYTQPRNRRISKKVSRPSKLHTELTSYTGSKGSEVILFRDMLGLSLADSERLISHNFDDVEDLSGQTQLDFNESDD
ncbi:scavenger receptor class B member 1-like isoform X4 [Varroa destructor]|uniref:Scavenger receptor class B member 1 n=1 Tax=Varroa destructor TaxID=109461 RepID=A0A7M7IXI2_VARDE|nr:scavenger receptor class B member 1-like isoform X4 [Varroa destructor]